MARKLRTKKGHAEYRRRKAIVEPVFGQIKEARGFRRFHLRGQAKVTGEWYLVCAAHNLGKLFGATRRRGPQGPNGTRPTGPRPGRRRGPATWTPAGLVDRFQTALRTSWSRLATGPLLQPAIIDAAS